MLEAVTMIHPTEVEAMDSPTILSFDPGGITGWCVMTIQEAALRSDEYAILDNILYWEQGQIEGSEVEQSEHIREMMDCWDGATLLFEDFQLRTLAAELSPVRLTAVASYIAQTMFLPARSIFLQMPSLAMTTVTDDRLKSWGLYKKGQEHARDAQRHAITFLRRAKSDERLRSMAWPSIYAPKVSIRNRRGVSA